jgi:outer membrane protein OmpA-like peptidoglycan-associated protein
MPASLPAAGDAPVGSRNFVFRFMNALDSADLDGEVDIRDLERNTQVATFKANQNIVLKSFNKSGRLLLIGQAFGYRPVKLNLNFNKPEETQDIIVDGNRYVIPFNMTRLQKGDKEVMYNVYFFKDAGVMRPESRPEVNSLLEMMNQNSKYKIMIHGHTNGNKSGKIISMGDSKKFFSLEGTKQGYGSAKKLSEERAKVIRDYLVANGVSPGRAEIKAWGGKKPIHDEDSAQARENVRVEIEILEDK